ncbi:MAG: G1 family glutamic endopeptidase [Sporolactobacillus sp.]
MRKYGWIKAALTAAVVFMLPTAFENPVQAKAPAVIHQQMAGKLSFRFSWGLSPLSGGQWGRPGRRQSVQPAAFRLPSGTEKSSNWAGYAVTGSARAFTAVSASWSVPAATGMSGSVGAQWIGIGGYSSADLLQMGTIEELSGRQETTELFWEQLPAAAQDIGTVPVGSKVTASITPKTADTWLLIFSIAEPGGQKLVKTISATVAAGYAAGIETSAEWISEDPSDGNGNLYPLANTGMVNYTNVRADGLPLNAVGNVVHPLAVTDTASRLQLIPSDLTAGGAAFYTENVTGNAMGFGLNESARHFRVGRHHFLR